MKRYLVGIIVIFGCYSTDFPVPNNESVMHFVNVVQKRYYVIHRLEEAVERLLAEYKTLCGQCMKKGCSLERELSLVERSWRDCLSYKHIMNDNLTRELLIHIIVLYDALLKVSNKNFSKFSTKDFLKERDLASLLDEVDVLAASSRWHSFDKQSLFYSLLPDFVEVEFLEEEITRPAEPNEDLFKIITEPSDHDDFLVATIVRFYVTQRLDGALQQLKKISSFLPAEKVCAVLPSECSFISPVIRDCIFAIQEQKTLQPLMEMWDSVRSYRYIGDAHLIRELLLIVVQVYQLMIKALAPQQEQSVVSDEEILDLYGVIAGLPLPDLLILLDDLSQQSSTFVSLYQQGKEQGWKVFAKNYWWLPPVAIAGVLTLCMRIKKYINKPQYRPFGQSMRHAY